MKITYKFGWRYMWYDFWYKVRQKTRAVRKKFAPRLYKVSWSVDYSKCEDYQQNRCDEMFFSDREDIVEFINSVFSAEEEIRTFLRRENPNLTYDELDELVGKRYNDFDEIVRHIVDYNDLRVQSGGYSW